MAESATAVEKPESRAGDGNSNERVYVIRNAEDEATARATLLATAPASVGALGIDMAASSVEPIEGTTWWIGTARYTRPEGQRKTTGTATFNFDTGGATEHITQGLETQFGGSTNTFVTDYANAIGVTKDGVEGVDVVSPRFEFSITTRLAAASMTTGYIANLRATTGRINNAEWSVYVDGITLTFAKGEALLMGVSGSKRESEGDWELTFRFSAQPSRADFDVGGITVTAKEGWSYLWVRYREEEDAVSKRVAIVPEEVFVERVYEYADFSLLGLPTPPAP